MTTEELIEELHKLEIRYRYKAEKKRNPTIKDIYERRYLALEEAIRRIRQNTKTEELS